MTARFMIRGVIDPFSNNNTDSTWIKRFPTANIVLKEIHMLHEEKMTFREGRTAEEKHLCPNFSHFHLWLSQSVALQNNISAFLVTITLASSYAFVILSVFKLFFLQAKKIYLFEMAIMNVIVLLA